MRRRAAATLMAGGAVVALAAAGQEDGQAIQRMAATERAFAAATAEIGTRDGFLTFFAPDAVRIEVGESGADARVRSAIEPLRARTLTTLPLAARLMWEPCTGQVSSDGSIGWLTGPYVTLDERTTSLLNQGAYFSIWKRQDDGTWRVWFDDGVAFPTAWRPGGSFRAAPEPDTGTTGSAGERLAAVEEAVAGGGEPWAARLASSVRVHRDGHMPIEGRVAAVQAAGDAWSEVRYTVARLEPSAEDDLAFALGGYDARAAAGPERGVWARAWKRDVTGRWRVVFEFTRPAS